MINARQRKAANESRQRILKEERGANVGDPVLGNPTPITVALNTGQLMPQAPRTSDAPSSDIPRAPDLNFYVSSEELNSSLARSEFLTHPAEPLTKKGDFDPQKEKEDIQQHEEQHKNAQEAIRRIMQVKNGNYADRSRINIQRCIDMFGRHNTDAVLPPKPAAADAPQTTRVERAGPDTGSSEVQIAVLTTKILKLAKQMEGTSHKDKHNKRNLRLLVHKRQKHLNYLRRKERGGPRWQNIIEALGLSDATWKGEISL